MPLKRDTTYIFFNIVIEFGHVTVYIGQNYEWRTLDRWPSWEAALENVPNFFLNVPWRIGYSSYEQIVKSE